MSAKSITSSLSVEATTSLWVYAVIYGTYNEQVFPTYRHYSPRQPVFFAPQGQDTCFAFSASASSTSQARSRTARGHLCHRRFVPRITFVWRVGQRAIQQRKWRADFFSKRVCSWFLHTPAEY